MLEKKESCLFSTREQSMKPPKPLETHGYKNSKRRGIVSASEWNNSNENGSKSGKSSHENENAHGSSRGRFKP